MLADAAGCCAVCAGDGCWRCTFSDRSVVLPFHCLRVGGWGDGVLNTNAEGLGIERRGEKGVEWYCIKMGDRRIGNGDRIESSIITMAGER